MRAVQCTLNSPLLFMNYKRALKSILVSVSYQL